MSRRIRGTRTSGRRWPWIYLVASLVVWVGIGGIVRSVAGDHSFAYDATRLLGYVLPFVPPVVYEWRTNLKTRATRPNRDSEPTA